MSHLSKYSLSIDISHPPVPHNRLGERLINARLISRWQLKRALKYQALSRQPLGHILVDMGLLSKDKIEKSIKQSVREQEIALKPFYLGEFLVKLKILTPQKLQDLLIKQRTSQTPLGDLLIEEKVLTNSELEDILSIQYWVKNGFSNQS